MFLGKNMNNREKIIYNRINYSFISDYEREYMLMDRRDRQNVIFYCTSMYRRWFYSALVSNTMVNPASFCYYLSEKKIPVIYPVTFDGTCCLKEKILDIDVDTHYILEDIFTVKKEAYNGIRVTDERVEKSTELNLMKKLNLQDPFYLVFLLELIEKLGIISTMPSINTRVYIDVQTDKRINMSMILQAACEITADKFNMVLEGDYITPKDIFYLIKSETAVDKLAEYVLEAAGIYNSADILAKDISQCSGYEKAVYLLINKLIPVIERDFITVFSFYLRLIKPLYTQRYCMKREMEMIRELLSGKYSKDEKDSRIYRCPTMYFLTFLGSELTNSPYNNIQGYIFNKVDPELLLVSIDQQMQLMDNPEEKIKTVYTIKLNCPKLSEDSYCVKFLSDTVINEVWGEIYRIFNFESQLKNCKVKFCFDTSELHVRDTYFSSDEVGDKSCFTAKLSDLVEHIGQHLTCITYISTLNGVLSEKIVCNMEVTDISQDREGHFYPVVVKK